MVFCPLFSGSSGNALLAMAGRTRVLIDAGLPGSAIAGAMETIGASPSELDAILITHEHSDHIKGAGILSRRYGIPIYASEGTWTAMERKLGGIAPGRVRFFTAGDDFFIGQINVKSFSTPHDAADPVGYRLFSGRSSLSVVTDIGHFPKRLLAEVAGSDLILLESNHDPDMLKRNPHYPSYLKNRILGNHGHLSNADCAEALAVLAERGTRHVVLGHLSSENNLPSLAYETACEKMRALGMVPGEDIMIDMAYRDRVGGVYTLTDAYLASNA